jgi:hypothetical protein
MQDESKELKVRLRLTITNPNFSIQPIKLI